MKSLKFTYASLASVALALSALAMTTSCNKSSGDAAPVIQPNASVPPVFLDGLSTEALIKAKYDKLQLVCKSAIDGSKDSKKQANKKLDGDGIAWDLINDYSDEKTLQFGTRSGSKAVRIILEIQKITIQSGSLPVDNKVYRYVKSPLLAGHYQYKVGSPGHVVGGAPDSFGDITFSENVETKIADSKDRKGVAIGCKLKSQIKSPFTHQFSVSDAKKK